MSWPRLEGVRAVTVFDANENRGKECERLGKITERKGFENQFLTDGTNPSDLTQPEPTQRPWNEPRAVLSQPRKKRKQIKIASINMNGKGDKPLDKWGSINS